MKHWSSNSFLVLLLFVLCTAAGMVVGSMVDREKSPTSLPAPCKFRQVDAVEVVDTGDGYFVIDDAGLFFMSKSEAKSSPTGKYYVCVSNQKLDYLLVPR